MKIESSASKYLTYGIHKLRLTGIEVMTSKTGSKKVVFQGINPGGQPIKINSSYLKTDAQVQSFLRQLNFIANAIGKSEEFENTDIIKDGKPIAIEEVTAADVNTIIDKFIPMVVCDTFAWYKITGEEYQTGKYLLQFNYSANHNVFVRSIASVKEEKKDSSGFTYELVCGAGTKFDNLTFDINSRDIKKLPLPNDITVVPDVPQMPAGDLPF